MLVTKNTWQAVAGAISSVRSHNPNDAKIQEIIAEGFASFCDGLWVRALDKIEDLIQCRRSVPQTEGKQYALEQLDTAEMQAAEIVRIWDGVMGRIENVTIE